jgi:hypothetical protein
MQNVPGANRKHIVGYGFPGVRPGRISDEEQYQGGASWAALYLSNTSGVTKDVECKKAASV